MAATETMRDAKRSSPACGMAATKRMRGAKRSSTACLALLLCASSADALSAPTTPSPPKWSVALNLGREPGSSMPKSWAASGARFFLQADVDFLDLPGDASEPFLGRGGVGTAVAASATFTGLGGKQTVAAGTGAGCYTYPPPDACIRTYTGYYGAGDTLELRAGERLVKVIVDTVS